MNTQVVENYNWKKKSTDTKSFEFNLESNGRLNQPMKFEIINLKEGGYCLYEESGCNTLIELGNICLKKENEKHLSFCFRNEENFDYHGIYKALCGRTYLFGDENFTPKRILVIQMI